MTLPLFDEPAPPTPAVERITIESPEYFAFWTGVRQGRNGQGESFRYDPDDRVDQFYKDGHRIGRLFRPTKGT